jgi:hypothetical protein
MTGGGVPGQLRAENALKESEPAICLVVGQAL